MMSNRLFLFRLKDHLPRWVEAGLINGGEAEAILAFEGRRPSVHRLPLVLYTLGALLLGVGVITWVAANWEAIGRLVKVGLLFGALWACYGVSAAVDRPGRPRLLAPALRMLGVVIFSANIQLIAQVYHIEAHYPNGVLMWALGGILAAWLLKDQGSMLVALVLATIWSGMETLEFGWGIHWPYLVVWALCLPPILRHRWRGALWLALLGVSFWAFMLLQHKPLLDALGGPVYLIQLFFLDALVLALLGRLGETRLPDGALKVLASDLYRFGLAAALLTFFIFTFPDIQRAGFLDSEGAAGFTGIALHGAYFAALAWLWKRIRKTADPRGPQIPWDEIMLAGSALVLLVNLFVERDSWGGPMAVAFNIVFLAGLIRIIIRGLAREERFQVNLAFAFFGLTLLSRYFDVFWSLLNRSYFFMGGGLLVLVGGLLLDRQRRRLLASHSTEATAGEAS